MLKIQRISQFQHQFDFKSPEENFSLIYGKFLNSDLGKIYSAIPWSELVKSFDLKDSTKGPSTIFSPQGKIALMFLKNYAGCSDKRLIEQLNANFHYQIFCDLLLPAGKSIDNFKIVSQIRTELSSKLDINKIQKALAFNWLSYMQELNQDHFKKLVD